MNVIGPTTKTLVIAALAVVATGGVGAALGLSGLATAPEVPAGISLVDTRAVTATDCVDGPAALELLAGQRVVAVARSDDGAWIGVRTPAASRVVWVPAGVVTLDEGEPDAASLPVGGGCPEVVIVADEEPVPEPTEEPAPDPGPNPDPGPAPDTTAPTLGQPSANPNPVFCDSPTSITVTASDDRGVDDVMVSWSGYHTGSTSMTSSGSTWTFGYTPPSANHNQVQRQLNFQLTAYDDAGNTTVRSFALTVDCLG